ERLDRSLRMVPFVCFHRANNGQLVHVLRYAWEDLRDLDARSIRGNRSEAAISFDVPAVQMADSSLEPYQNDRLCFGLRRRSQRASQSLNAAKAEKITEPDTHETERSNPQKVTTRPGGSKTMITICFFHVDTFSSVSLDGWLPQAAAKDHRPVPLALP